MAGLNQRIPHESRARLQDPSQRDQISGILGLDADSLTNADLQPLTGVFGGAGRVKKFRQVLPSHSNVPLPIEMESPALANLVNTTNQRQSQRNDGSSSTCRDADVENAAAPVQNTAVRGTRNESRGYPALARFIGSDTDFFLFRKFNTLCARRLLYLQDELMELEARLDEVDSAEVSSGGDRELWNLHSRREDNNSTRTALMAEISRKLQHYHEAMAAQARVLAMDAPPEFVIESVANWIDGMKPVVEKESHFLDCRDDLASLSAEHSSKEFLDNIIERKFYQYFVTKACHHSFL
ncbi:uncharacterized protein K441DRAFT_682405 [Cenococcum geophilum 1.58]|uniref:Uncharacterized protein n=1 Tax=Cenococcum geophilum 1.58 TaxID=794803 RepID=A0ACC8ENU8_9PEZI|nr:hypothetical protein K441DRAFT_682405 [Cenococcum geophilum 1.58]